MNHDRNRTTYHQPPTSNAMKTTLRTLLAAAVAAALCAPSAASAAFYAKSMAVTAPGVPAGVTLADFPLLVRLSADIAGFDYADFLGAGGSDLRFFDASGNLLPCEVDTWNEAGESLVWVKVPSLSAATQIVAKWGSAAPDANVPADVWSNYAAVWHGNPDAEGSATAVDSTANARVATPSTSPAGFAFSDARADHLGSAWLNSSTTAGVKIFLGDTADNPLLSLTSLSRFAASAWVKSATTSPDFRLFSSKESASGNGFEFMAVSSNSRIMLRGNGKSATLSWTDGGYAAVKSQAWTHMACTIDGTAGAVYVNGAASTAAVAAPTVQYGLCAGGYGYGNNTYSPIQGYLDELRIYDGVPSADYLAAECAQVVTAGYVAFGAVEDASNDAAEFTAAPAVVRNADGSYTVSAALDGPASGAYAVEILLNDASVWSGSWSGGANAVSWTTDATVAAGTYLATVSATAPSGAVTRRTAEEAFLVGDVVAAAGSDALEQGLVPGSFVLSRPGDASVPLVVAVSVASATATEGVSYAAPAATAAFAPGASTATVAIVPLVDASLRADATLTLSVLAGSGLYGGAGATASIALRDYAIPAGANVWVAGAASDGLASTDANWSLGRAPVAGDAVRLGLWSVADLTWDAAATHEVASWTQDADYAGTVTFEIAREGADVDEGFNRFSVAGDVALLGGAWTHPAQGAANGADSLVERYVLDVSAGGGFAIGAGAAIDVRAKGRRMYTGVPGWFGLAAHGGFAIHNESVRTNELPVAERTAAAPYGSILEPVATGAGAVTGTDVDATAGFGGGAILIAAAGNFVNDGLVRASGQVPVQKAGGSGGSVFVRAANILGTGSFDASGTASGGTASHAAGSGGRISLVATGAVGAGFAAVDAHGSRAPDEWVLTRTDIYQGAAGTVWRRDAAGAELLVRNVVPWTGIQSGTYYDLGKRVVAQTPVPGPDDDAAAFRAAASGATLRLAENARVRLAADVRARTLSVCTDAATPASLDLHGRRIKVDAVVGSDGTSLAGAGVYTLADAIANGWTWLEDASAALDETGTAVEVPGTGELVVGMLPTVVVVK